MVSLPGDLYGFFLLLLFRNGFNQSPSSFSLALRFYIFIYLFLAARSFPGITELTMGPVGNMEPSNQSCAWSNLLFFSFTVMMRGVTTEREGGESVATSPHCFSCTPHPLQFWCQVEPVYEVSQKCICLHYKFHEFLFFVHCCQLCND